MIGRAAAADGRIVGLDELAVVHPLQALIARQHRRKKPVLPRYECLEKMDEGEFVEADDTSIGGGGPAVIPCNWLQHFENVVDPYHVPVLHGSFSGPQFTNMMAAMPEVKFEMSPRGVTVRSIRTRTTANFSTG